MDVLNLIGSSTDDSDEEPQPRRRKTYRPGINFGLMDPEFKERFRLRPHEAEAVLNVIASRLLNSGQNMAFSPQQQLLVTLHWLGNGGQYHGIGDMHGVSKATVCRIVNRVVTPIVDLMFQDVVRWPDDLNDIAFEFTRKVGFPNVAGCADGTHITIDSPSNNESAFVNRHGDHSINSLMICGPNYSFYFVSARWPGSVHDSRVMKNSTINNRFESRWRPFLNAIILGDSGYGLRDWLIPHLHRNPNDQAEQNVNRAHVRTRGIIENAFGILKERFPCLKHLRLQPESAGRVIMACATLHNIATVEDFEIADVDDKDDPRETLHTDGQNVQPNARLNVLLRYFSN